MLLCFSSAEMLGFHEEDHGACNHPASAVRSQSVELTAHRSDHNLRQERQYPSTAVVADSESPSLTSGGSSGLACFWLEPCGLEKAFCSHKMPSKNPPTSPFHLSGEGVVFGDMGLIEFRC